MKAERSNHSGISGTSNSQADQFENLEEMLKEAADTFQRGIGTLNSWSEQARELIQTKPGVILAAVGVSGFVVGSLLRHGWSTRKTIKSKADGSTVRNSLPGFSKEGLPADPLVLLIAGAVAGLVAGPRVIQEALMGIERYAHGESDGNSNYADKIIGLAKGPMKNTPHADMDERPFEKV
jgi:hypothetical protein